MQIVSKFNYTFNYVIKTVCMYINQEPSNCRQAYRPRNNFAASLIFTFYHSCKLKLQILA